MATILLWGCFLTIFGQLSSTPSTASADSTMTLSAIVDQLAKRESLFFDSESLLIRCAWGDTDHLFLNEAEEKRLLKMVERSEFDPNAFPQQKIMRTPGYQYELGKRGRKLYQKVVNPLDLKYGPRGLTAAYDGSIGVELQEVFHATIQEEPPAYTWQNWDYAFLQHLNIHKYVPGLDPKTQIPPAIRPINLPQDIVESESTYALAGEEAIDGVPCIVLDKQDMIRFWLDPKLGCAVRRVDTWIGGKERVPGTLKTSVTMSDFRESKEGLWLPWAITEVIYYTIERGPANLVGKPAVRRTLSVSTIEFDKLADDFFELKLPADVLVHDNIHKIQYVNQQDGVPFWKAIDYANQKLGWNHGGRGLGKVLLIVGNAALVILLVWTLFFRRKRSEPTP